MIVRYSRRAQSDLAGILEYIEERSPSRSSAQSKPSGGTRTSAIRLEEVERVDRQSAGIRISCIGSSRRVKSGSSMSSMPHADRGERRVLAFCSWPPRPSSAPSGRDRACGLASGVVSKIRTLELARLNRSGSQFGECNLMRSRRQPTPTNRPFLTAIGATQRRNGREIGTRFSPRLTPPA